MVICETELGNTTTNMRCTGLNMAEGSFLRLLTCIEGYSGYYALWRVFMVIREVRSWKIQEYEVCSGLNG